MYDDIEPQGPCSTHPLAPRFVCEGPLTEHYASKKAFCLPLPLHWIFRRSDGKPKAGRLWFLTWNVERVAPTRRPQTLNSWNVYTPAKTFDAVWGRVICPSVPRKSRVRTRGSPALLVESLEGYHVAEP
jgi:hypothetical protein